MIYLQFPENQKEEYVKAGEIKKPDYFTILIELFKNRYSTILATKYAYKLTNFLNDEIDFPTGVNYWNSETNTFFKYLEEDRKWKDTKKTPKDYVITEEASLWKTFFEKNIHYKNVEKEIKKVIKKVTSQMLEIPEDKLQIIEYIHIEDDRKDLWYKLCKTELDCIKKKSLCEYFSTKALEEVYLRIVNAFFGQESELNYIMVFERGYLKGALNKRGFEPINEESFKRLYEEFKSDLEEQDLKEFVARIRNQIFYKKGDIRYPIKSQDDEGKYYTDPIKDLTVMVDEKGAYIKLNKKIVEEVIKILENHVEQRYCEFNFFTDGGNVKTKAADHIKICFSKYNISLRFECDRYELYTRTTEKNLKAVSGKITLFLKNEKLVCKNINELEKEDCWVKIEMESK